MIKLKIGTVLELAEMCAEYDMEPFEIDKSEFPIVIVIEDTEDGTVFHPHVSLKDFEAPDFIAETSKILEWHDKFVSDGMEDGQLMVLIKSRSRLSYLKQYIGSYCAQLKKDFKDLEFKRRRVRDNVFLMEKGKTGVTVGEANARARIETEKYDHMVTEAEKAYLDCAALQEAVDQTLNAMSGEIRDLQSSRNRINQSYEAA